MALEGMAVPCPGYPAEGQLRGRPEFSPRFIQQTMLWFKIGERAPFLRRCSHGARSARQLEEGLPAPIPQRCWAGRGQRAGLGVTLGPLPSPM